jgi:hypothetical protein
MPTPAQLWPERLRTLWRQSLYVLTIGWVCMHAVHLEEVCAPYPRPKFWRPSSQPLLDMVPQSKNATHQADP